MLFRPLFGTSFLMQSYCEDHDFYGANALWLPLRQQRPLWVWVSDAQALLGNNRDDWAYIIEEQAFVEGLDCMTRFSPTMKYPHTRGTRHLIFDVAGNADVVAGLHTRLGNTIPYSGAVGKTHWNAGAFGAHRDLPGAKPVFWSAPDQIAVLRERIGSGAMMRQMGLP